MRNTLCWLAFVVWAATGCREVSEQRAAIEEGAGTDDDDIAVADHGLEMTAMPLRPAVPAEGPLLVEITVRNHSDSVIRFRPIFNFGGWLDADIVDSLGSPIPKTADIDPPNVQAVSLKRGESFTDTVDLRCSIPSPKENWCMAPYDFSDPGAYEVKMQFTLPCIYQSCDELVTVEAESFNLRVRE